jgi:ribosomal protein L32
MSYNITREDGDLVVRIPLKQNQYNHYMSDEPIGETNNLVGVIADSDYTLSHSIDMSYCGKPPQEGMPILHFDSRAELENVCKEYGIAILEHDLCTKCGKVIYGTSSWGDKGEECVEHGV